MIVEILLRITFQSVGAEAQIAPVSDGTAGLQVLNLAFQLTANCHQLTATCH